MNIPQTARITCGCRVGALSFSSEASSSLQIKFFIVGCVQTFFYTPSTNNRTLWAPWKRKRASSKSENAIKLRLNASPQLTEGFLLMKPVKFLSGDESVDIIVRFFIGMLFLLFIGHVR